MTRAKGRRVMTSLSPEDFEDGVKQEVIDQRIAAEDAADPTTGADDSSVDRDFYNIFDGTKGRTNGVYLDIQERVEAEKVRAIQEKREPDLSEPGKLPAATGTPLVPQERQVDNSLYSNPSIAFTGEKDVDPVTTLNVDTGTAGADADLAQAAQVARERQSQDEALSASVATDTSADEPGVGETGPVTDVLRTAGFNTTDSTI